MFITTFCICSPIRLLKLLHLYCTWKKLSFACKSDSILLWNSIPNDKNSKYFGFRIQFPAAYDREFYASSEEERSGWVKAIQEVAGGRHIEDYYDVCEMIGEGRFAQVYRVRENWVE